MKKLKLFFCFLLFEMNCFGQINCEALYEAGSPCYLACKVMEYSNYHSNHHQGSRASQIDCDSAISLCPTFAYAYYTKAIPYLKRGEFITWKSLIDKAVEYDSTMRLGYRAGTRFMFLRDYEGAIRDIELMKTKPGVSDENLGSIYNGDYHLNVILALSYKGIGDTVKAAEILKKHVLSERRGFYDYYHLGVMFYQTKMYDEAEDAFQKQTEIYSFADVYYYIALINKLKSDVSSHRRNIEKAYYHYNEEERLPGRKSYMDYPDKIYLKQIKDELDSNH